MISARFKKTAYRTWHRGLFQLQRLCGKRGASRYPVQTIFVHVPKTAGSSINEYFASFTGSRRSRQYVPIDMFREDGYKAEVNEEGLQKARNALYVTGHIDWHTVEAIRQPRSFVFTVLRDPAERLLSSYHYLHRHDENDLKQPNKRALVERMKSLTFEEFCTSDDPAVLYATNNFMVRQLSDRLNGTADSGAPFQEMLDRALKNIATLDYVGFQQTVEEDFQAIVRKTGFPPLRLAKENVTKNLKTHSGSSYSPGASKQDILKLAAPRLEWDIALYREALSLAPAINGQTKIKADGF